MTNDCNTLDISKMIKIPLKSPNDQNTLVKMQKITKTPPKLPNYSKYLEIFKNDQNTLEAFKILLEDRSSKSTLGKKACFY